MNKNFVFRPYQIGDEEEIVKLLELGFNGWPKVDLECSPLDHWRWKYQDNVLETNFISVCIRKGRIISTSHSIPIKIKIGRRIFLCSLGADATVHPNFRRMGIYKNTREMKFKSVHKAGISMNYIVTSNPVLLKFYMKTRRPCFPFTIKNFVRIRNFHFQLQVMPVKKAWLKKLGYHVVKLINDLRNAGRSSEPINPNLHFRKIRHFDDRIEIFWKEVASHYDFIVERSRDYLNWRYFDPRAGEYVVNQIEDDQDRILGYNVLRINKYRKEYPIGYIVDLLALPNRPDVVDMLVDRAIRYFDNQRINIVNSLIVKNHPYGNIFNRYGFLDTRIKLQIYYNYLNDEDILKNIKKSSAEKIHFSYGDIDSLPVDIPKYA